MSTSRISVTDNKKSNNGNCIFGLKKSHIFDVSMPVQAKTRGVSLPAAITDGLARLHAQEQQLYRKKLKRLNALIRNLVLVSMIIFCLDLFILFNFHNI